MRLGNLWYLIKQGFKNVFHNSMMSFSCIGVLIACMLLIGSAVIFTTTVNNIVGTVENNNEMVVYLADGASEARADTELAKIPNILEIAFISKEEALATMVEKMGDEGDLMKGLEGDENPLLSRYRIRIDDPADILKTISAIEAVTGVEKVKASTEVAEILAGIKQTVYYAGIGIVIILILVSLAIITNTIKITIFSRRREINIMKYVGATDMFIRFPFLVEGLIIGLSAAFLAFLLLGIGYPYLIDWAKESYGSQLAIIFNNAANFEDLAVNLLAGFCIIGASIGLISSTFFVRKHLKV